MALVKATRSDLSLFGGWFGLFAFLRQLKIYQENKHSKQETVGAASAQAVPARIPGYSGWCKPSYGCCASRHRSESICIRWIHSNSACCRSPRSRATLKRYWSLRFGGAALVLTQSFYLFPHKAVDIGSWLSSIMALRSFGDGTRFLLLKVSRVVFRLSVTPIYGYTKFFRLNTSCFFSTDVIISKMKTSLMKQSDILFAISSTGRTKSILEIAKLAKEIGVKVISICDFSDSPLSNISDIAINTTIRESNKFIDTDFPLIQAQITIIDILYACAYIKNHFASYNFNKTNNSINSDKI